MSTLLLFSFLLFFFFLGRTGLSNASLSLRAQFFNRTTPCILGLWLRDRVGGGRRRCVLLSLAEPVPGPAGLLLLK